MREVFRRESRIIAVSLALGLGATACGGKSESAKPVVLKIKAQNAVFLEHKSAEIEYSKNRRRATITPGDLVFEEFCIGSDMHIQRLGGKTLEPVSEGVHEGAKECQDGRITPEDFGETLKPPGQDLEPLH